MFATIVVHVYLCLAMFTPVYLCIYLFTYVELRLLVFTSVYHIYSCMFTYVFPCLFVLT